MFLIAGVSGNTGKVVADTLLKAGKKVRVLVREASKAESWRARGAEVAVGSVEDAAALKKALAGATGAYLLVPPDVSNADVLARGKRVVDAYLAALQQSPVGHVAFLSSVGAHHAAGNGPIRIVHDAEQRMNTLKDTRFTWVRAAYFMENLLGNLVPMKEHGILPVFGGGESYPFPMVASRDIGATAAEALLKTPPATQIIELSGPAEYSFSDAARVFSEVLGKPITPKVLPLDAMVPALRQAGLGESMARLYLEMTEGMGKGLMGFEGGSARAVRGTTALPQFVQSVLTR